MCSSARASPAGAQVAGSFSHLEGFRLPDGFTAGTFQGPGERVSSHHQDYRINLKAGYEPGPGQEYSVSFIDQVGQKGNPPPDGVIPQALQSQARFWSWPQWNKQSAYWLSQNTLDEAGSYLRTPSTASPTERRQGYEIELSRELLPGLDAGVSWSVLTRVEVSGTTPAIDTPGHRLSACLGCRPLPYLALTPSIDLEGPRTLQDAVNTAVCHRTGSHAVAAFKASHEPSPRLTVDIGASNLLGRNYLLADGYHAPGREYFADMRVRL